ncbi:4-azaleucine resistance transporter AzlC [Arthrobacter sp. 1088]|uniref:AzlC family ABC transporter permease n=1 Tax=Arthrobacter sp. 1088 TaxID=2817768 RepID=UPI002864C021|nr:AzlC family ABC transporter permease [Arthrobacter sp. 1088]MDR6688682.1 4-azaleucine resistance transporter AzlC [Arthrobacter sp. 1088]
MKEPMLLSDAGPTSTNRGEVAKGLKDSLAAGLGMFPLGVAFGLMVMQSGLPWWVAPALSIAGFAGSLELLLIGMMLTATPLATIALTTFLVNFRHVFYAFSFPLHIVRNPAAKFYSVYALIDEAYAVTAASSDTWTSRRLLSMQLAFQSYWVGGGLAGVLLAALLPGHIQGLEFALCALFVTLTLDAAESHKHIPSVLLAGLSFTVSLLLVPDQSLFVALLLFLTALMVRYAIGRRRAKVGGDRA